MSATRRKSAAGQDEVGHRAYRTLSQDLFAFLEVVTVVTDGLEHVVERVTAAKGKHRAHRSGTTRTYRNVVAPVKTSLFISRLRNDEG